MDIKIIFKTYLKILKTSQKQFQVPKQTFILQNIIKQFSKTVLKNYFFRIVLKNNYQIKPKFFVKLGTQQEHLSNSIPIYSTTNITNKRYWQIISISKINHITLVIRLSIGKPT